jgi:hypothetical protein
LQGILYTNGYNSNLGQNVVEWTDDPLGQGELFRLEYRSEEENRLDLVVGEQDMALALMLRVLVTGGTSIFELQGMLSDVSRVMYADPSWGGLASDTVQDGVAQKARGQAADIAGGVQVKYRIEYSVDRGMS